MVNFDWLECDPDELERLLIAEGRRDKPPAAARRRTLASVTVAAAAGATVAATSMSATAAASGAVPWIVATKWVAVGVAAGAVTLGAADRVHHHVSPRAHAQPVEMAPPIAALAPPRSQPNPIEAAPAASEVPIEPSSEAPAAPRIARPAPIRAEPSANAVAEIAAPPAEPAPSASAPSDERSLAEEVRLLEDARRALDAHAASRALRALDRYEREFPAGRMGIEASALRIETLVALGQRDAARAFARSFLTDHPRSPAAMRVARLLDAIDSEEVKR